MRIVIVEDAKAKGIEDRYGPFFKPSSEIHLFYVGPYEGEADRISAELSAHPARITVYPCFPTEAHLSDISPDVSVTDGLTLDGIHRCFDVLDLATTQGGKAFLCTDNPILKREAQKKGYSVISETGLWSLL
jgi:hypothetical protein